MNGLEQLLRLDSNAVIVITDPTDAHNETALSQEKTTHSTAATVDHSQDIGLINHLLVRIMNIDLNPVKKIYGSQAER